MYLKEGGIGDHSVPSPLRSVPVSQSTQQSSNKSNRWRRDLVQSREHLAPPFSQGGLQQCVALGTSSGEVAARGMSRRYWTRILQHAALNSDRNSTNTSTNTGAPKSISALVPPLVFFLGAPVGWNLKKLSRSLPLPPRRLAHLPSPPLPLPHLCH
ncbi:hypothetical protein LZ31DRAFT_116572 [Colletotrichum somersetense]|nr:hypothetical protein LZ31DRAFT_116572 [Colletotrichum somersetense]